RQSFDYATRVVAGAFGDPHRAFDFLAFQDDAGRFDSAAKLFLEACGGPRTDDEAAVPVMAGGRAQAPSPGSMGRGRLDHLMAILAGLAARAMEPEAPPLAAALPVARDHTLGEITPGPVEPVDSSMAARVKDL